jgi:thymidylate synthase (FAD)
MNDKTIVDVEQTQPRDPFFRVELMRQTPLPNSLVYMAMRQDHLSEYIFERLICPDERECGNRIVKHLLSGSKGHYGVLEAPQITLACGYFPHSVMQQLRTHRIGISFDVQSFRFTSNPIEEIGEMISKHRYCIDDPELTYLIEKTFYLRPAGDYQDPENGSTYTYDVVMREEDIQAIADACASYYYKRHFLNISKEHARGTLPFDMRQHFVVSMNMRSMMHLLQIRSKKDAQLEVRQWCDLVLPHFEKWSPEVYQWFMDNLYIKGKLAP